MQSNVSNGVSAKASLAVLRGVVKRFGEVVALSGIDVHVESGQVLAVLGPNGAGKSTAISILLGLQQPDAGTALLFGRPPDRIEARRNIGVMMQEVGQPAELTVKELIRLTSHYYPCPLSSEETIELAGIVGILDRRYGGLSGGQKRLAQFALSICGNPKLLFLDEPTTHLDNDARETLWAAVRKMVDQGTAVVLTTHHIEEAEALADAVTVVSDGCAIRSGTVNDIRGLVLRKLVDCGTSLSAQEVASWPEAEGVESIGAGRMRVTTHDAEGLLLRLLTSEAPVSEIEVHRASLADALKLLTHRESEA